MNGLEELIERALALMATDDDFMACCNKPPHKALAISRAMVEAGRRWHEFNHGPLRYGPPTIEACVAFPCRVTREFGDLSEKPELISTISGPIPELEPYEFSNCFARVHTSKRCEGQPCTLHNPSDHKMRDWPKFLRISGLIERMCPHFIGHPDPDSVAFFVREAGPGMEWMQTHGCDGCCRDS